MTQARITTLLIPLLLIFTGVASADLPHRFSAGDPARASEVMGNFDSLDQRITALETRTNQNVDVDCSADVNALINTTLEDYTTYTLTGMCNGPIHVTERRNVVIQGDGSGVKDDGIMLPSGLTEHPFAALGVYESKAVTIENLTISSDNYKSKTYSFGENVSTLHSGDQSHVDVYDVNFIGGDYPVVAFDAGQINLRSGVQVIDFNRTGVDATRGSIIRIYEDTTVTGLNGTSTDDYPSALNATANSVVEVRNGGTYTGARNSAPEYPYAVWAGDNGMIRIRSGSNPTVINGAIEVGYSAMIRIDGNTTINGVIGAYHLGYIRAVGITQSGGVIWVGDGAMVRIDSSTMAPTVDPAYPDYAIDIYRNGKLRTQDSNWDLSGKRVSVGGLSTINLRGSTTLNGADIDCGNTSQISVQQSVINNTGAIGNVSCWGAP